jgi:hypothetical protein
MAYLTLTGAGVYKWVDDQGVTHYSDSAVSGHDVTEVPVDPEIPPEQTQRAQENLRQRLDALEAQSQQRAAVEHERREAARLLAEQRRAEQEAAAQRRAAAQAQSQPPYYPGNYGYGWGGVVTGPQYPPWGPGFHHPPHGPPLNQPSPCDTGGGGQFPPCSPPPPQPNFTVKMQ